MGLPTYQETDKGESPSQNIVYTNIYILSIYINILYICYIIYIIYIIYIYITGGTMEVSIPMIWNIIVTLIVAPMAWWISHMSSEVKRLNILINLTRENYIKREDHQSEMSRVVDHLVRLEGKIDKLAEKV